MNLSQFELQFADFIQQQQIHDAAHDLNHIKRVVQSAKQIAYAENADLNVVVPAAWLHDCVSFPKNHPDNKRASVCAADKAIEFLTSVNYDSQYNEAIHHAICAHSYSAKIPTETLEAQVVQDADRLDGLGAIGVSRCMLVAGKLDSKIYSNDDPFCQQREPNSKIAAVDHFYEKLFKTAETMKTNAGKTEADKRVRFMKLFLSQLSKEIDAEKVLESNL
ncbi:HD domain-containing protein [Psychrosphaera sp. B3R10]|uniref:HD domain-containing protein n=1 Tax=Psychrosphaera algicola TaxID=3023714 RepID=A0ABT5FE46_9GAMM|nr:MULTISPECIES: HD domain-containing protein [unclassified Psychrosphaera]MBU2883363.1 HD domain-containing protein [Psychrosphaera sp. I2R16]MBU2990543.1 HD domain-containing protein [Psychrosphaera sp. B3R10]MDC2889797.1 HD domain-containing protein [Psychrosphaera sp. G1-22]